MLNRRQISLGIAAFGLTGLAGCKGGNNAATRSISKVGIQSYTLRAMYETDPLATFKMIKDVGYDYVELNGGNFAAITPANVKSMLDDVGLDAPGSHISYDMLNDIGGLLDVCRTFGFKFVVVPWIDENARKLEDWKAHAALMNTAGRQLADNGVRLAYHNHQFEFDDLGGGTRAMDILLGDCAPENLDFEIDLFWAALADADIAKLFKENPGRFKQCHIKDMGSNKQDFIGASYEKMTKELMQNVGEGILPFEEYFALNDLSGIEYFIAEHDSPKQPYRDAIETSLSAIRGFRF